MPMANPFANPAFSAMNLTQAINEFPTLYGRIQQLGLFRPIGINTRTVAIEKYGHTLALLPTKSLGSPGTPNASGSRTMATFNVPHIPHDDAVLPADVINVRRFGSENELEGIADVMSRKLQRMRNAHSITLEHMLAGTIAGKLLDSDGSVLYDYEADFGVPMPVVDFDWANTTDVRTKCLEVTRHIEDGVMGELFTGVRGLASPAFFTALISHADVKDAYARWQQGAMLLNDPRAGFNFAGITFEEYRGKADDGTGNMRDFIADGDCRFVPEGTNDIFTVSYAPADMNEAVGTNGIPMYASQEARPHGRGTDIHTQSNPLPVATKPGALVRGHSTS